LTLVANDAAARQKQLHRGFNALAKGAVLLRFIRYGQHLEKLREGPWYIRADVLDLARKALEKRSKQE